MTHPIPPFVEIGMDELRRSHCRVSHGLADIERCPRCWAVASYDAWRASYDAWRAIVQEPQTSTASDPSAPQRREHEQHD